MRQLILISFILISLTTESKERDITNQIIPKIFVPKTNQAPVIDGQLTELPWQRAAIIEELKPSLNCKKVSTSPCISVKLLWDPDYLYISFICKDNDIFCSGSLKRDDNLYLEDVCEIFLDGQGDGRQYIELQINPKGEILDLMFVLTKTPIYNTNRRLTEELCKKDLWCFRSWNYIGLKKATSFIRHNSVITGWIAELAIPASILVKRLGLKKFKQMTIKGNFLHYDWKLDPNSQKRNLTPANWSPVQYGCPHISPAAMGLIFLKP